MRILIATVALACIVAIGACGSKGQAATTAPERLIGATLAFTSLDSGKDDGSSLTVQLLRNSSEIAAEVRSVGTPFDDNRAAPPLAMSVAGPFNQSDAQAAQLRLRMVPEGRDTWTFNARLSLTFADGMQRNYGWIGVRLDEASPERTLTLAGAQTP